MYLKLIDMTATPNSKSYTTTETRSAYAKLGLLYGKTASEKAQKKIRVLSIDGGGIKGIIPATILVYLEQKLQEFSNNPDARIADYFDLLAGTSTGGILTCAYLIPDANNPSRPKLTAEQALSLYLDDGKHIFSLPFWRKIRTLFGWVDEKYSHRNMERLLKKHLGSKTYLSQLLKPCLIPAYDIESNSAVFFNSMNAKEAAARDTKVWQVARATAAAPTFFEPTVVKLQGGDRLPLVDGGVFANNPAMCAYTEVNKTDFSRLDASRNLPKRPTHEDILLVSIGTGKINRRYLVKEMRKRGKIGWAKPVVDMMMSGSLKTVDHQLKKLFAQTNKEKSGVYFRFQMALTEATSSMDDTSPENLTALHQTALIYIEEHRDRLDEVAAALIAEA